MPVSILSYLYAAKLRLLVVLVLLLSCNFTAIASAPTTSQVNNQAAAGVEMATKAGSAAGISTTSTAALAAQVILGLVVVVGLMLLLAWLARRTNLVPNSLGNQGAIHNLAVQSLGSKEKLLLVQVGEEQLLLGITSQQITCLHKLTTPIQTNTANNQPAFAKFMQHWLHKNSSKSKTPLKAQTLSTRESPVSAKD